MADIFDDIESQIVPKYRNYYVSFKQLIEAIGMLKDTDTSRNSSSGALLKGLILPKDFTFGDTTAIHGLVEQRAEVRFASLLQHEVSKLNHFTALEVKTMLASLRQQERRLARILSGEDAVMSHSARIFPSVTDEAEILLPPDGKLRLVAERLSFISQEMLVLENYVKLNTLIFQRVVERFDRDQSAPIGTWFLGNLLKEPFCNIPLEGLFSIVAKLFSTSGITSVEEVQEGEKIISIPPRDGLRAKLVCASMFPIQRPESIPESVWSGSKRVPMRSEDLGHDSLKSSSEFTTIVSSKGTFTFVTRIDARAALFRVELNEYVRKEDIEVILPDQEVVKSFQYTETRFGRNTRFLDNMRTRTGLFDFKEMCSCEYLDINNGFDAASFSRMGCSVLITSSKNLLEKFKEFKILNKFSDLENITPFFESPNESVTSLVAPPSIVPPPPHRIPVHNPRPLPKETKLIYPKDFMANERSVFAWMSAISVQAGIGVSLLSKSGVSFIGGVISLTSIAFLWWAVYVFIQRYRHLKNTKSMNSYCFYSMELPTYFGLTQIAILTVQILVFLLGSFSTGE